ncbi:hypothetical protein FQN53_006662 [Emmonsiellopsis sp. PD_33]|nr:hypothetical protein FQN53_006662 [Emmonsiellopsis sp. PD_33]
MTTPAGLVNHAAMVPAVAPVDTAVTALNTVVTAVCSEFGFCGTTEEFCGKNCQSNCVLHPKPPGGSAKDKSLSRVIGYYEAWNDRSKCHGTKPEDLPVDGLTHINYAFAYISPDSFEITTMDAATPVSLFDEVAALKIVKPSLQIYVSIGGWTFSDNNTITQPVFGNIARSASNRQKFADNILSFLNQYGFDGVDIDWEYPGAPDRGGKEDDTKNFVLLMKTIRETFTKSGRKLGLTFTGPSSYWYMRWFDIPGLLKYCDWMNLMSYDLHGVWDSQNPIGSIVQGHTNLTEIKRAVELLWRVKVPPSKVALGFGFYGRAFTLQDPNCIDPGCPFSGGAKAGVCTGTSGYLSHYEIADILNKKDSKRASVDVIHDKEAAVKYFAWDSNQWISYDDGDTFKQKSDWADDIGFSGSLIWASDLDDYELSAHKALTGKSDLGTAKSRKRSQEQIPIVDNTDDFLGKKCWKYKDQVDLENPQAVNVANLFAAPVRADLKIVIGGDPEVTAMAVAIPVRLKLPVQAGGVPLASLAPNCHWSDGVGSSCKDDEESIAYMWDRTGWGTVFKHGNHYCCKKSEPIPYKDCHWVGTGDCADNTCSDSEVTLEVSDRGWRKKSLCCTPNTDVLTTLDCDINVCGDDDDCEDESGLEDGDVISKRSYIDGRGITRWTYAESGLVTRTALPGTSRNMLLKIPELLGTNIYKSLKLISRPYPPGRKVFKGEGLQTLPLMGGFRMLKDTCESTAVQFVKLSDLPRTGFQAEHLQEIQMVGKFLKTAVTGYLPSGAKLKAQVVDPQKLLDTWHKVYDVDLPRIGAVVSDVKDWTAPLTPNDRVFEIIGSYAYRTGMSLLPGDMNLIKKNIVNGNQPMAPAAFNKALNLVAKGDMEAAKLIAGKLQKTIGVFNYLNDAVLRDSLDKARSDFANELVIAGKYMPGLEPLAGIWEEFEKDLYGHMVQVATAFVVNGAGRINNKFSLGGAVSNSAVTALLYQSGKLAKAAQNQIKFTP